MKKHIAFGAALIALGAAAGVVATQARAQLTTLSLVKTTAPIVRDANGAALGRLLTVIVDSHGAPDYLMILTSNGYVVPVSGSASPISGAQILYANADCTGAMYTSALKTRVSNRGGKFAVFDSPSNKWLVPTGTSTVAYGPTSFKNYQGVCTSLKTPQTPSIDPPYYAVTLLTNAEVGLPPSMSSPLRVE
jgi:hypothetical protein